MNPLSLASIAIPPWAKWVAVAALAVAIWAHGWVTGNNNGIQKYVEYVAEQATASIKIIRGQERIVVQVEEKIRTVVQTIREKGETIIKEVPVYVTDADNDRCIVPVGFVRHHDAAAGNTTPGPAEESDRADSGYTLDQVAETSAANLTTLDECRSKLDGWREFYAKVKALRD